jgi:hypothetical protein
MPAEKPLLIQCPACGIENLLADIVPGVPAICNQCRESLVRTNLVETHTGHNCDSCGMAFLLNKENGFKLGKSECQCGSSDFSPLELDLFVSDLQSTMEAQGSNEDDGDDFDWCRPGPDAASEGDYNNIFDDDPGFSK